MKTRFEQYSDIELVEAFNREVGNKGWASARAEYLTELHREFDNRGYDYSEIGDSQGLSFKNKIKLEGNIIKPL